MAQTPWYRFRRRIRTYGGRVMSTLGGGIDAPVFFMHIPKCGGTSVSEALYATVPIQKRVGVIDANATRRAAAILVDDVNDPQTQHDDFPNAKNVFDLREKLLINHMAWNSQLIHGHVLFSDTADRHFGTDYRYVTVLREPKQRVLSNYAHSVVGGLIADDFDTYLQSPIARAHCLTFLRYFSGTPQIGPDGESDAFDRACETLAKFSVVGFLDDLAAFQDRYQQKLGTRPRIPVYNAASKPAYEPNAAQTQKLDELLKTENAFWNYACDRFRGPA